VRDNAAVRENWKMTVVELLDLHPDLPFDRILVAKVCDERMLCPGSIKSLDELAQDLTINDFLALYINDASRVEFLAFYVEEVKVTVSG
jgi:hypothetical protein